jgi:hypothetical protein
LYKAPANEVVAGAIGFEQQEVLHRSASTASASSRERGYRLWSARTLPSDPEWKYMNVRRYFVYLEHSIDRGTQWAVFEPNGRRCGRTSTGRSRSSPQRIPDRRAARRRAQAASFVKCARATMTQNDLDNGHLVCLIGIAVLKPAEFVILRIGQWTDSANR